MSALQFLREKAGVLVAGFIGLSLFIFVVSDFFGKGRSQRIMQRKYYEIGQIAGERVSYQDYEQRIQNLEEIYKLLGTTTIDEATLGSIREQMWQQLIRERILESKYKDLGIGVSTEELNDLVLGNDPHPVVRQLFTDRQTGQFNRTFLVNFLKSIDVDETAKKYWMFFEDQIVSDRMNTKYNTLVSRGLYATSLQAEFEKNLMSRTVDFSYMMKSYSQVPDSSIVISENELHTYYTKHKESYSRSAERDIEYVTFDIIPSEDDFKQAKDWIDRIKVEFQSDNDPVQLINTSADTRYQDYYIPYSEVDDSLKAFVKQENRQEVYGPYLEDGSYKVAKLLDVAYRPDSVHARHILISPSGNITMIQAKEKADSLVDLIKNGASFATLAEGNSNDQGSAQAGGDLGWFKEGTMVAPFSNVCFTAKRGELNVVETTYGVHIIEVLDQSGKEKKYNIGIIDRKVEPGNLTNQKVYSEASQFAGNNDTYDKFTKTVADQKLNIRVANNITPQQQTLPGLEKPRLLIMSLFQASANRIILDANKQAVFEIGDKYVVAYCTKVTEAGPAPFKDVESDVRFSVLKDKKADIISSELKNLETNGKTLDQIAVEVGVQVQEATQVNFRSYSIPGAGIEPALIAAATVAEQGAVSGPVKGNNGVFLLTVNNITTPANDDLKLVQERLASTFEMRGAYEAYDALVKSAKVIDKRYKFY